MMNTNNFVSRLRSEDFLEFANKYLVTNGKNFKSAVIRSRRTDYDGIEGISVLFKSEGFMNKSLHICFYQFYYGDDSTFFYNMERILSTKNKLWRDFLTKKFGKEYVDKYADFIERRHEREKRKIEFMLNETSYELQLLRKSVIE